MEKAPTPPGVGASIKGGGQENELERTLPLLYYQIVLCTSRKRFEENDQFQQLARLSKMLLLSNGQ